MAQANPGIISSPLIAKLFSVQASPGSIALSGKAKIAAGKRWRRDLLHCCAAYHAYSSAQMEHSISLDRGDSRTVAAAMHARDAAFRVYVAATDRMMGIPALTKKALNWKRRHAGLDCGRALRQELIELDAVELD